MKKTCSIFILLTFSLLTGFAQGRHARVTLTEPGTLEATLYKGGFTSIDSLTLAGTFGGDDLNFLRERGEVVSGLAYLNLTDAVLTNDEVPYATAHNEPYYNFFYLAPKNSMRYVVTETGGEAHWYRCDLTYAFREMKNLKTLLLPKTMTNLGASMCYQCENLEKVTIPAAVDSVGSWAFKECKKLTSISAPNATRYGYGCFDDSGLTSYTIPQGTQFIPSEMFRQCPLTTIIIPSSVTHIGYAAFIGCDKLVSVKLNEGLKRIDEMAFGGDWRLASMNIPSTLQELGMRAFMDNPWTESLKPQGGIIYVGNVAYEERLEGAQTVTIKEGTLGLADALLSDKELISIKLPSTLKVIGHYCFNGNTFTKLTLPEGLEKIGMGAFSSCNRITTVTIPESVKMIGMDAFRYCERMTHVDFNAIDARIFTSFANLSTSMGGWVSSTEGYMDKTTEEDFYLGFEVESSGLFVYPFSTEALKTVTFGPKVKHIPAAIFMACPNLENVQMGGAIESIGRGAFSGCTNLKSIDLTGVKRIDALAFVDHEIEEFTLPPTLERIGQGALRPNIYYHRHPTKVWSQISNPAAVTYLTPWGDTATGYVIYDFPSSWYGSPATLYVPRGTKAKYEALPSWKNSFAAIEETDYDHVNALSAGTKTDKQWHTLQGTDVSNPTRPGIYINGNRKKIVK